MAKWRIEKNFHKDKARKTIYSGTATFCWRLEIRVVLSCYPKARLDVNAHLPASLTLYLCLGSYSLLFLFRFRL